MLKYLDLALLQAFTAVVDSGSFTRAAVYLCRTQSAVSMQLRKLEDLTGHALLQRDKRKIRLTEEGEVLLDYARRMIRLNEEALVAMNQPHAVGHVRLGMPDDYAHQFLPGVLTHFAHAYPRVQLEVIGALSGALLAPCWRPRALGSARSLSAVSRSTVSGVNAAGIERVSLPHLR